MSTINVTNSSLRETSFGHSGSSIAVDVAPGNESESTVKNDRGPASTVELSDRAKALLERSKAGQAVAQQLSAMMQTARQSQRSSFAKLSANDLSQVFQAVADRRATDAAVGIPANPADMTAKTQNTTQWQNGAPYGDPTLSDEDFLKEMKDDLLWHADYYDQHDFPPEVGNALREAVKNGTVKVQRAQDVPDLNFHSTHTFTPSSIGGGYDVSGGTSQNPVGATKEAIEQGGAIAMWNYNRGDIYISW